MTDLITAIGFILFIEGLTLVVFPLKIKNMIKKIEKTPENKLRNFGFLFLIFGFLIIWYIKQ